MTILQKYLVIFVSFTAVSCSRNNSSETSSLPQDSNAKAQKGSPATEVQNWGENANTKAAVYISFIFEGKKTHCTGTNIGDGQILTAEHCRIDCNTTILTYWDSNEPKVPKTARCQGIKNPSPMPTVIVLQTKDVGLIAAGSLPVDMSKFDPKEKEQLRIYYFSDLGTLMEAESCMVLELTAPSFEHNCSTKGGASGALLVSEKNPSRVVGIHQATGSSGENTAVPFKASLTE